ncbi:predicted protein [Histoplasma capsulatum H143]|uniref:Uncharacterized protein n=1 Tax=Ajellomyces capsulatus (strain H143) TaxID=544712 RepID=C6HT96_AJECH|nr:predicted protein [Histoplasma capsulatum H143]
MSEKPIDITYDTVDYKASISAQRIDYTHTVFRQEVAVKIQHNNIRQLQYKSHIYIHFNDDIEIPSIY